MNSVIVIEAGKTASLVVDIAPAIRFLASIFASSEVLNYTVTDKTQLYVAGISMLLFQFIYIAAIIFHWARRRKIKAATFIVSTAK